MLTQGWCVCAHGLFLMSILHCRFPLSRASEAYAVLQRRQAMGKVLVVIDKGARL